MEIVLVEDNQSDILMIKDILEAVSNEINIIIMHDGADAISYINSDHLKPNLFILDINLPHFNGFEVLKTLKQHENKKNTPVIVFTSSSSKQDEERAMGLGAAAFVSKPFEYIEYVNRVKEFIEIAN